MRTQELVDVVNKVPLGVRVLLAALALMAVLAFNAVVAIKANAEVFNQQQALGESLLIERDLGMLLSEMKDVETSVCAYYITGHRRDLDNYFAVLELVPAQAKSLAARVADDDHTAVLAADFLRESAALIAQSTEFVQSRAALRQAPSFDAFSPMMERQQSIMDRLRLAAKALRQEQNHITGDQGAHFQEISANQRLSIVLPSVISAFLAIFIFSILFREARGAEQTSRVREQSLRVEREARAEAEAANQAKDDFVSMVSHELRTPLQSILGWTQFLARYIAEGTQVATQPLQSPVTAMGRSAQTLARMIDDLLDVSRALTGKLAIRPQAMDFGDVVRQAVEIAGPAAAAKRVRLLTAVAPQALNLVGDVERLRQVVANVIGNAIKFTPVEGTVAVAAAQVNSHIELRVKDTGIGIAPDLLPRIFDRYVQASSSSTRQYGGLGLGLAIVKHLVEMHGGQVQAHSDGLGQGAEFVIRLPIAAVAPARLPDSRDAHGHADEQPQPMPPPVHSQHRLEGMTVMVVDDDEEVRNVLTTLLSDEGASVLAAVSAREALALLTVTPVHLVLSDIGMPDMDGYALARAIRALRPGESAIGAHTALVALTAFSRPGDVQRAFDAGFNHHLAKPVDFEKLVQILLSECPGEAV